MWRHGQTAVPIVTVFEPNKILGVTQVFTINKIDITIVYLYNEILAAENINELHL